MSFISFDNIVKILTKYWDKFLIDGVGYTARYLQLCLPA